MYKRQDLHVHSFWTASHKYALLRRVRYTNHVTITWLGLPVDWSVNLPAVTSLVPGYLRNADWPLCKLSVYFLKSII